MIKNIACTPIKPQDAKNKGAETGNVTRLSSRKPNGWSEQANTLTKPEGYDWCYTCNIILMPERSYYIKEEHR